MVRVRSAQEYLNKVAEYVQDESWETSWELAELLSFRHSHVEIPEVKTDSVNWPVIKRNIPVPFDSIVALHLKSISALSHRKYEEAFRILFQILQTFSKEVIQKRKEENWFLPVCYTLCTDLRLCAKAADQNPSQSRGEDETSYYEQSAGPIMECYRNCVSDIRGNVETSKRLSMLNLTNQLFRIYFKINKLNLLKPLVRAIDNCGDPLYNQFSMADKVTYRYFTGRRAMFDSDFKTAEDSLSFAFHNCLPECRRNKRLILMYLIPVKMFLGHMPSEDLLARYDLAQFSDVAKAVRQGNLLLLVQALNQHEPFFIKCGIFLMLEKLKIITYRTLFKKVCNILNTHQVPLEALVAALKFMNVEDTDNAEVACIVANLIYQGKVKGYISHQHQKLVISKQNAFPALSTVPTA